MLYFTKLQRRNINFKLYFSAPEDEEGRHFIDSQDSLHPEPSTLAAQEHEPVETDDPVTPNAIPNSVDKSHASNESDYLLSEDHEIVLV
jgi:hypothetical protein